MTKPVVVTVGSDAAERAAIARWENEGGHAIPLERRGSLSFRAEADPAGTTATTLQSHDRSADERPSGSR
jgi:hypothetical protein